MKNLLIVVFIMLSLITHAQKKNMKYGKIDKADMIMKTYDADPNAEAVVLGESMRVIFNVRNGKLMLTYHYHTRIKILTKKGMDRANIALSYWSSRRAEKITKVKAQTLNWKDGKLVKTVVEKKDIFTDKKNKYISEKRFAFPAVEVGSVLEYYYEQDSDYFVSVNDYFFQQDIPVIWSDYKVEVLESLKYRSDLQGKHPFAIKEENSVTLNHVGGMLGTEYHWRMTNIPALKKEPYITSMYDYYAGVRMRLASYEPTTGFHERYIGTWPEMNALYFKEIAEKSYLKENYSDNIWADAKRRIKDIEQPKEKMAALYKFVQNNIKWNDVEEINPDHTADYCYSKGEGSNSEINLTLLSLLQKAGIEAYPLLVCTRNHHKPMSFLQYLYQFNQTLVVVIIDGKTYYLDASDRNYPMTILPRNNLNVEGWMIVDKNKGQWIGIPASRSAEVVLPTYTIATDGIVTGTVQVATKGYVALNKRAMIKKDGKEKYSQSTYLDNLPNSTIENHTFSGLEDIAKPLKEKMEFSSSEMTQVSGDMIYFNPFMETLFPENPFKRETREIPVDMAYAIDKQSIIKITIPEGYLVEALPEAIKMSLPNNGASFMFATSQTGNTIQIVSKVKIYQTYYTIEEYGALRNFVDLVINKQQEQIVLKKE